MLGAQAYCLHEREQREQQLRVPSTLQVIKTHLRVFQTLMQAGCLRSQH
jgi:hypothetical protein